MKMETNTLLDKKTVCTESYPHKNRPKHRAAEGRAAFDSFWNVIPGGAGSTGLPA